MAYTPMLLNLYTVPAAGAVFSHTGGYFLARMHFVHHSHGSKAHRTWRSKTEIKQNCRRLAVLFQSTVNSFVLFQFHQVRPLRLFQVVSAFCCSVLFQGCVGSRDPSAEIKQKNFRLR